MKGLVKLEDLTATSKFVLIPVNSKFVWRTKGTTVANRWT